MTAPLISNQGIAPRYSLSGLALLDAPHMSVNTGSTAARRFRRFSAPGARRG